MRPTSMLVLALALAACGDRDGSYDAKAGICWMGDYKDGSECVDGGEARGSCCSCLAQVEGAVCYIGHSCEQDLKDNKTIQVSDRDACAAACADACFFIPELQGAQ